MYVIGRCINVEKTVKYLLIIQSFEIGAIEYALFEDKQTMFYKRLDKEIGKCHKKVYSFEK